MAPSHPRQPRLILCDCAGTFRPDAAAIAAGAGFETVAQATLLCGRDAGMLAEALGGEGEVVVACAQMAETFAEIAAEAGRPAPATVDIRDRAGWTRPADLARTGPKQAALLAAARLGAAPTPVMDVESGGLCLVLGGGGVAADAALDAAARLSDALSVTVLLDEAEEIVTPPQGFDIAVGRVTRAAGALGRFALTVDGYRAMEPAGRGALGFGRAQNGAETGCDVILDLRGTDPLFPAPAKRDGYLRADPRDPAGITRAVAEASQLEGSFEKPLHIRFEASLCAHARAGKTGCTRCLSVCPTGAIIGASKPDQEAVVLDHNICAGCGACAAVCPSGAALSSDPPVEHLYRVMRVMAEAWEKAGGKGAPRLLVHCDGHGAEMIRLAARHSDGLPHDVLPLETRALAAFGHAEMLVALALGYSDVTVLAGPKDDREVIAAEMALADAVLSGAMAARGPHGAKAPAGRLRLVEPAEPDALCEALYAPAPPALEIDTILASGGRRDGVRLAAKALAGGVPDAPLPLPEGAPYGAVIVNEDACTLCLACAGLCPTGALMDNPDSPELSFREEACVQCGICANVCPEDAITLRPQLELSDQAFRGEVKKAEEPFACIECGTLFGVKSTVEKIIAKLEGNHALFTNSDNVRLIQMCDDCRVKVQFRAQAGGPFAGPDRPRVRTTDDYLKSDD
ncbi:MAG: 4Fe-4S binding protein [Pseudomonadota bacterium]